MGEEVEPVAERGPTSDETTNRSVVPITSAYAGDAPVRRLGDFSVTTRGS